MDPGGRCSLAGTGLEKMLCIFSVKKRWWGEGAGLRKEDVQEMPGDSPAGSDLYCVFGSKT